MKDDMTDALKSCVMRFLADLHDNGMLAQDVKVAVSLMQRFEGTMSLTILRK